MATEIRDRELKAIETQLKLAQKEIDTMMSKIKRDDTIRRDQKLGTYEGMVIGIKSRYSRVIKRLCESLIK